MDKHLSSQFDEELTSVSARVMEMGGLVEAQLSNAIRALSHYDARMAEQVIQGESAINAMEVEIDGIISNIIARRQPTARDLRLLIAISKTTGNLERAGDEAKKIAKMVNNVVQAGSQRLVPHSDLKMEAEIASALLRRALDALARLDVNAALSILQDDDEIDREFEGIFRKLITYMMEDPRTISASLDMVFVAKAIERIGDHAKNIAEFIIYVVKGTDVRHSSLATVESVVK